MAMMLVVDDEPSILKLCQMILRRGGHEERGRRDERAARGVGEAIDATVLVTGRLRARERWDEQENDRAEDLHESVAPLARRYHRAEGAGER